MGICCGLVGSRRRFAPSSGWRYSRIAVVVVIVVYSLLCLQGNICTECLFFGANVCFFFLFVFFSLTVLTLYEHNIGFKIWTEFNVTCRASSECLIVYLYQVLLSLALQPPSTIAFSRNSSNIN